MEALNNGVKVLNHIGNLGIPYYFIHGNWDDPSAIGEIPEFHFKNKKNMFFIHNKIKKFKNIFVIGYGGYRVTSMKEYLYKDVPRQIVEFSEIMQNKRKMTNEMERLFGKVRAKQTILLTHDPPYKTFDYLKIAKKFYGEKITRKMIEKFQPLICICSHFHEHQGIMKIGKTIVVNTGDGKIGQMAFAEIENNKVKAKLVKL
jgi:Icc-related predicted phosphoesterase